MHSVRIQVSRQISFNAKTLQFYFIWSLRFSTGVDKLEINTARGGGGLPYETDGDARREIRIKP